MKINVVPLICAVVISALICYGFYAATEIPFYAVVSAVASVATLAGAMGIDYGESRKNVNIRVSLVSAFLILTVYNIIAASLHLQEYISVIVNGIVLVLAALIAYLITKM